MCRASSAAAAKATAPAADVPADSNFFLFLYLGNFFITVGAFFLREIHTKATRKTRKVEIYEKSAKVAKKGTCVQNIRMNNELMYPKLRARIVFRVFR